MSDYPFDYVDDEVARRLGPIDVLVDQHSHSNYHTLAGLDADDQRAAAVHVTRLLGGYALPDRASLAAMDTGGVDYLAARVTYARALARLRDGLPGANVEGLPEFLATYGYWYLARNLDTVLDRVEGWEARAVSSAVARTVLDPAGVDVRHAFQVPAVTS